MEEEKQQFCRSCAMPLEQPDLEGMAEAYCEHCVDQNGKLRSREEIRHGIAQWIMAWQHVDIDTAMQRAEHYMKAMPAWAEKK
jgi:uncharacterized paraquat-inducible protein A